MLLFQGFEIIIFMGSNQDFNQFEAKAGPIYKLMYNRCLDHTLDVQRHSPSIAVGASRISFRQFKFQAKSFKSLMIGYR